CGLQAARAACARATRCAASENRPARPADGIVKRGEVSQRWVFSLADLTLLLLAFFVMMQAQVSDRLKLVAGMRGAFGGSDHPGRDAALSSFDAATIFEHGEAILKPGTAVRLKAIGARAADAGKRVIVAS